MIELRLSLLMLLAHLIGDFVLQDEKIIQMRFPKDLNQILKKSRAHCERNRSRQSGVKWPIMQQIFMHTFKGNLIHAGIHGITLTACVAINNVLIHQRISTKFFKAIEIKWDIRLILIILGLTLSHFIIDTLKVELSYIYPQARQKIWLFLIDQLTHLISFYALIKCYRLINYPGFINSYESIKHDNEVPLAIIQFITSPMKTMQEERLIWIGINFIGMTFFAGILISQIIGHIDHKQYKSPVITSGEVIVLKPQEKSDAVHSETKATKEIQHGGYIIGVLERILILCALLMNQPQFIGYILTAKSIARLSKLKEDRFAEYFLIGNSLSFIIAIIGGNIIKVLVFGK